MKIYFISFNILQEQLWTATTSEKLKKTKANTRDALATLLLFVD